MVQPVTSCLLSFLNTGTWYQLRRVAHSATLPDAGSPSFAHTEGSAFDNPKLLDAHWRVFRASQQDGSPCLSLCLPCVYMDVYTLGMYTKPPTYPASSREAAPTPLLRCSLLPAASVCRRQLYGFRTLPGFGAVTGFHAIPSCIGAVFSWDISTLQFVPQNAWARPQQTV